MTGIEYMNTVCPTTSRGKDPNREDVADAFEDGIAEGLKQKDKDFEDGVWLAIQHLVIQCDQPTMAKEIARDAGINKAKALSLQMVSGYEDMKMIKFINREL